MATGIGTCRANRSHVCNGGRKESMLWRAAYSMQEYQWRPALAHAALTAAMSATAVGRRVCYGGRHAACRNTNGDRHRHMW